MMKFFNAGMSRESTKLKKLVASPQINILTFILLLNSTEDCRKL